MKKKIILVALIVLAISASIYFFHIKKVKPVSTTMDDELRRGNVMLNELKGRGEVIYKINRYKGMIAFYVRTLPSLKDNSEIKKKLSELYFELGKIELDSGDNAGAKMSLEKALSYDPGNSEAKGLIETIK